ncbi:MAG: MBL fold metallo-hydrolase [Flavobacteriaceae bacterium]|nr:MBL fold metallo-hydrolase [Flavobacteriaceae bacterium]
MDIKFCGAAQTVTGSCFLLKLTSGQQILIDCGLYQGGDHNFKNFNEEWNFDPKQIDALILTHAHIDHSGRIPKLVKDGFKGNIYCTNATRNLCRIMLADSAYIQEREAEQENRKRHPEQEKVQPLYTVKDAEKAMLQFVGLGYERWFELFEDCSFRFQDAGHILGSASVAMQIKENGKIKKIGFTGDIGRPDRPLLKDSVPIPAVDYLVCESTYGDKLHYTTREDQKELLSIIQKVCIKGQGKLIIPAFSIGRTQEIVYLLNELEMKDQLPKIPIYVDSPLAINATNIYLMHPECFDQETHDILEVDPNPLGFKGLKYTRNVEESKAINNHKGPAIIISASGMMTAGRIRHHVYNKIEDPKNAFLIVGFCAPGTLGRILSDGAKEIKIMGETKKVNAQILQMNSFSAHGDQKEMIDFLKLQDKSALKEIFLVHGEIERQEVFARALRKDGFQKVSIPSLNENVRV